MCKHFFKGQTAKIITIIIEHNDSTGWSYWSRSNFTGRLEEHTSKQIGSSITKNLLCLPIYILPGKNVVFHSSISLTSELFVEVAELHNKAFRIP